MQHAEDVSCVTNVGLYDCMIPLQDDQMTSLLQRQHMHRQVKWKVEDPFSLLWLNGANHVNQDEIQKKLLKVLALK